MAILLLGNFITGLFRKEMRLEVNGDTDVPWEFKNKVGI